MNVSELTVKYNGTIVGKLALDINDRICFSYDQEWLINGFSISPLSLPLIAGVFYAKNNNFNGLHGVFNDSLPDGWGMLLLERKLKLDKININDLNPLDLLVYLNKDSIGGLEYIPSKINKNKFNDLSYDDIQRISLDLLDDKEIDNLDELFKMGGSSGGARPKVYKTIKGEDWLIKFRSSLDKPSIGKMEYDYNKCAEKCGIEIPKIKLFESNICDGYFGALRFDRNNYSRVHLISVSGLLETSHHTPNLDYVQLLKLTSLITKDYKEVEKMYRQMCFNVFAHNEDDHSKNFSFIYDEGYKLSPAYDLTYSSSYYGQRATTVNGKGKNITEDDLLEVASEFKIKNAKTIIDLVKHNVENDLCKYMKNGED